ncbi:hypothetical protein A3731_43505 [Roseovarius sp. HI0049]|nr:hypothetical protein A3731_43505 [Roseovarius sp. HI0049]
MHDVGIFRSLGESRSHQLFGLNSVASLNLVEPGQMQDTPIVGGYFTGLLNTLSKVSKIFCPEVFCAFIKC